MMMMMMMMSVGQSAECLAREIEAVTNYNNSVALDRELTIPTERLALVGRVSANFCG
jgi:hypothetical protein